MVDAVLSYHADPLTCGVTKFSQQLAKRLNVRWALLGTACTSALVSIKPQEMRKDVPFFAPYRSDEKYPPFDLFLHGPSDAGYLSLARRVFAASAVLADEVRPYRPDVISAWCPSLVEAQPREPIAVLSFGMAHKLRTDLYAILKEKLDATGEPYVVYVSAALHEGTSFSDAAQSFETLRQLFGHHFVFLGTIADEAMVDRLRTCTYVAAFFEHGLRENNTSVFAAIEHGATVLTNWDGQTPNILRTLTCDIKRSEGLPHVNRRYMLEQTYGWDKLVRLIRG